MTRQEQRMALNQTVKTIYYADRSRSYHNWDHIEFMLKVLRDTTGPVNEIVELAVLYHDVVYIPGAETNELMSERLLHHHLGENGILKDIYTVDEDTVWKAGRIIKATMVGNHTSPSFVPSDRNMAEVMDADLAAIGDPNYTEFVKTQDRVWSEHVSISEIARDPDKVTARYRHRTADFLARFLKKPVIYHTLEFRFRFEQRARENISQYICEYYAPET